MVNGVLPTLMSYTPEAMLSAGIVAVAESLNTRVRLPTSVAPPTFAIRGTACP